MKLSAAVKAYREKHNMTMDDMAAKCNVSKGYVSMLEAGKSPNSDEPLQPKAETIFKFAKGMDMRVSDLAKLLGKDEDLNFILTAEEKIVLTLFRALNDAGKNRTIPIADCILPLVKHFYTISLFSHYEYLVMPDRKRGIHSLHGKADLGKLYRKEFPAHAATHDSRHTFLTMCEDAGVRSATIKKIVGHVGGVTEDVYTHKSVDQLLEAVNLLPHGPKLGTEKKESGVATG